LSDLDAHKKGGTSLLLDRIGGGKKKKKGKKKEATAPLNKKRKDWSYVHHHPRDLKRHHVTFACQEKKEKGKGGPTLLLFLKGYASSQPSRRKNQ